MARFKLTIEYDGTGMAGWQRQNDQPSVQGFLEAAAEKLNGSAVVVTGAGRTDAGVHAIAQVAHMDMDKALTAYNVMHGMNYHLSLLTPQIMVIAAQAVDENFNARFSATRRRYLYRIVNRRARLALEAHRAWHVPEPLDAAAMHHAAQLLVGHHDFTTFRDSNCQSKSPLKTLERLDVLRDGEEIHIQAEAQSFLHHQVRNMAGTLRFIGNGKWKQADLRAALAAHDRSKGGQTAPAQGLYLMEVSYPQQFIFTCNSVRGE